MKFRIIILLICCAVFRLDAQSNAPLPLEIQNIYALYHIDLQTNTDTLIKILTHALQEIPTGSDPVRRQGLHMALADIYFNKQSYDQALRYLNIARTIFTNQYPGAIHFWISEYLGKAYFHRGNYLLAGQHLSDALNTKEVKENQRTENDIRDYILRIYNILPTFSLSEDFFVQSIHIKEKLGDTKGMKQVGQKLTDMLYHQHQFEKSMYYAQRTADLAKKLSLPEEYTQAQIDIVHALIRMNKKVEAKKLLDSLKNDISPSDFHLISRYETAYGDYELLNGNEASSEAHYAAALPSRAGPTLSQYIYYHKAESYKQVGNFKKAFEAQEKYISELNQSYISNVLPAVIQLEERSARSGLSDQVKYLNAQNQLKDSLFYNQKLLADALTKSFELQKSEIKHQQQLSEAMQHEVDLQKSKVKSEQRLRMLFIGSSLGLFLMGSTIFAMYQKQRTKNQIISKQSSENEILMKEIHHRVKNNLQIISSLLDMQSMSIKDPTAAEAIKEGKNRVLSMALIHQNLYHDGHIRSIKIDDYILHLSKSLFDSYNVVNHQIRLETDIAPLSLDVDTVVPLGLIINELITNSLKYAFKSQPQGTIHVMLKPIHHDQLHFQVRDDGQGFPAGWTPDAHQSFGYQLIKAFAKKIKGKLNTYNDQGAVVDLIISKYKLA